VERLVAGACALLVGVVTLAQLATRDWAPAEWVVTKGPRLWRLAIATLLEHDPREPRPRHRAATVSLRWCPGLYRSRRQANRGALTAALGHRQRTVARAVLLAASGHGSKLDVPAEPATPQIQSPATGMRDVDDGGVRRLASLARIADYGEWLLPESRRSIQLAAPNHEVSSGPRPRRWRKKRPQDLHVVPTWSDAAGEDPRLAQMPPRPPLRPVPEKADQLDVGRFPAHPRNLREPIAVTRVWRVSNARRRTGCRGCVRSHCVVAVRGTAALGYSVRADTPSRQHHARDQKQNREESKWETFRTIHSPDGNAGPDALTSALPPFTINGRSRVHVADELGDTGSRDIRCSRWTRSASALRGRRTETP
jgi:hypothetical protein